MSEDLLAPQEGLCPLELFKCVEFLKKYFKMIFLFQSHTLGFTVVTTVVLCGILTTCYICFVRSRI